MKKLLFIINPKAGRTTVKGSLFEMIDIFSNAGYRVEVYTTKGPGDAEKYISHSGRRFDVVVCAGGDGTLDNTVAGVMKLEKKIGQKIPLGYIPCGSTNDFARSLKISRNPVEAAEAVVKGTECLIDVGRLEKNYFIYVAAFGVFTDVSYSTPQSMKNILGHTAYVLEAFKQLTNIRTYKIEANIDGKVVTGEYIYGQITNSLSVGGFRAVGTKHMSFCDGKFECVFIRRPNNPAELQRILNSLVTNELDEDLIVHEKASNIVIECEDAIPWSLDGEFGGELKRAEIINMQKALDLILWDQTTYYDVPEELL